jgi:hypothetical protein
MIPVYVVILMWLFHTISDFVFQNNEDAINKWCSIKHLLNHTVIYSLLMFLFMLNVNQNELFLLLFVLITFILHTIQDFFTSKLSHYLSIEAKETGVWTWFFVAIGFDQFLHLTQLVLTYYLLT